MRRLTRLSILSLTALLMAGCADPKIDTSSMPAAVVSIEKVRDSLPTYKRDEFDQALKIIAMSSFSGMSALQPGRMNAAEIAESANAYMHGLTGDQVIERADEMLRQRRARERDQALRTLSRLEEKEANAEAAQQQLAQVGIKVKVTAMDAGQRAAEVEGKGQKESGVRMFYTGWSASTGRGRGCPWQSRGSPSAPSRQ